MRIPPLEEIAVALANRLRPNPFDTDIALQLVRLLANGRPVSPEQIASALQVKHADALIALSECCPDAELDQAGNVIGFGLTMTPTSHRFQIDGHTLFTWCALDTLFYPVWLKQTAHVKSVCPITHASINLVVTPDTVEAFEPASIVMSLVIPETADACCGVRNAFCNHVHFFSSSEATSAWLATHPDTIFLPIPEAYRLGHLLLHHRLKKAARRE
jgi:alkylmercury lyase